MTPTLRGGRARDHATGRPWYAVLVDMTRFAHCLGLGAVVLLAAGCASDQDAGGNPGDQLVGRTFLSTSVTDAGQPRELVAGTRVSLWFADDGRLIANAGCNTLTGPVDLGDGKLKFPGELSMTEMGCDAPLHVQDEWLSRLLGSGPSWRLDGDELVLTSPAAELVLLDRSVAEPDKPIEGTKWLLETILTADSASSVPAGVTAHLTFEGGRVTGSTGCNALEGPATLSGTTVTFGPLTMTRKACPDDQASAERAMVATLQGAVPFKIESNQLTLNPGAANGLGFRG